MEGLYLGDCLEVLKTFPENSIDSVVTDPPYGLSFMGKKWDYDVPSEEVWRECLRVLKPGGHLLAFAGTRTQHRMAVRIEDAGFEIRDMIAWVYSQGFPKSSRYNLSPKFCQCGEVARSAANTNPLQSPHDHSGTELASLDDDRFPSNAPRLKNRAQGSQDGCPLHSYSCGEQPLGKQPDDQELPPSLEYVPVHTRFDGHDDAQVSEPSHSPSEALCTCHLSSQDCAPAGSFESATSENIPKNNKPSDISESSSYNKHTEKFSYSSKYNIGFPDCTICGNPIADGFGTALKPALEPITVARKPLSEKTVTENVLTHGTGGLNIDGCRVAHQSEADRASATPQGKVIRNNFAPGEGVQGSETDRPDTSLGRFPANLIHDGSEEVVGLFPDGAKAKPERRGKKGGSGFGFFDDEKTAATDGVWPADPGGSAARFFYCAKSSRRDRNEGLPEGKTSTHPTVKPTDLMRYLCRLVTPPGGTVLDPFMGSGSTGKAAALENFRFIGIEREREYLDIAIARIQSVKKNGTLPL